MEKWKLFESEYKFMEVIWANEPLRSTELVKLCQEILGWKKSTTYTVLRKLCERGILINEDAVVRTLVAKEEVQQQESQNLLDKSFDGSLPMFLATFLKKEKLSVVEAEELKKIIDSSVKGEE